MEFPVYSCLPYIGPLTIRAGYPSDHMNEAARVVRDAKRAAGPESVAAYEEMLSALFFKARTLPDIGRRVLCAVPRVSSPVAISANLCADLWRLGIGAGVAGLHSVAGSPVLIIDDVTRRGASLRREASKARNAGATDVAALVYAAPPA